MKYAKLCDNKLIVAPNPLRFGGNKIYNAPVELLISAGFLPVEDTPHPDDGGNYLGRWEEQDGKIVRVWDAVELPQPEPMPEPAPAPELSPVEKREQAYDTMPVVSWGGEMLTVTQAANQWAYYAAEGDENKTRTLTALIVQAKQDIREKYPDGE